MTTGTKFSNGGNIIDVADKAEAVDIPIDSTKLLYIASDDGKGHVWRASVGNPAFTYSDDGGAYCGTVFIPDGGDGSAAWVRDYDGAVNVKWFGATGDGVTDDTTAFTKASAVTPEIRIGNGTFVLDDYRITNGEVWLCAGAENTKIQQGSTGNPAINCTSDASVGQLGGVSLTGFKVLGKASATVTAVLLEALGIFAIWRSNFDYVAWDTFRALEIQGPTASNVFICDFKVNSNKTSDIAVLVNGAVYNKYELFLTECKKYALYSTQASAVYTQLVTDGPIWTADQSSLFSSPTIEGIGSFVGTVDYLFYDQGFNNEYNQPRYIGSDSDVAKITTGIFRPFSGTVYRQPRINMLGALAVANPFVGSTFSWVLEGPGQNGCTNTINILYGDTNDDSKNLRFVSFIGDCSAWLDNNGPKGGANIQYYAPTGSFNLTIKNNTDSLIFVPAGEGYTANINTPFFPVDGQVISFTSSRVIANMSFAAGKVGDTITGIPTRLHPDKPFSIVYNLANQTWYLNGASSDVLATQTELRAIGDDINTVGKYTGKQVWDSSNNRPVWASGSAAGSVWTNADTATVHTPV